MVLRFAFEVWTGPDLCDFFLGNLVSRLLGDEVRRSDDLHVTILAQMMRHI
jgi:hypothetical protein